MALGMTISGIGVQAAEAPPSVVLESFACTYNDGQDMGDLLEARDYMVKQAAKAEVSLAPSYVWSNFKGGPGLDHIWFSVHQSLADFAAESEAFGSAPELEGVNARFGKVASCESNIANARPIFQGSAAPGPGEGAGPTFIASNACNFRPGRGPADLPDFVSHASDVLSGISAYDAVSIIMATPMTQGANSADLYIFSINQSPSAWAASNAAFQASEAAAALGRHFQSTFECGTALWFAEQVVGGAE
jgi:hypothetical protein